MPFYTSQMPAALGGSCRRTFRSGKAVYDRFRKWCRGGVWHLLKDALRAVVRSEEGGHIEPSAAVLDSQTVRSDAQGGVVGYDVGKKSKGRKRFIVVDTFGMLHGVAVAPEDIPERAGARLLLEALLPQVGSLEKLWVDGGYNGSEFSEWVRTRAPQLEIEIIKRSDDVRGLQVLPERWVLEQTFGWVMRHRRLVRDCERTESSAMGWLIVALVRIMLGRLT